MYKLIFVFVCSLLFFVVGVVDANTADVYISAIEAKQSTLSSLEKVRYTKKTFALLGLQAVKFRHDAQQVALIATLQEYLQKQLYLVPEAPVVASSAVTLVMDIPGVDLDRVRSAWLQWHNEERSLMGKSSLTYHFALESTATTWANYL
jgi:hypothetical protein